MKPFILFFSLLFFFPLMAQEEINQLDTNGKRHGLWKKHFEEDPSQIRYQGTFEHGKEVGQFTFYLLGQEKPAATKVFTADSDIANVKFLSQKGKLISEGKMRGEERLGEWKYYHLNTDKLMMTENYKEGVLEGEKIIYFENGSPAERSFYANGQLQGEQIVYSEKGVVLKIFTYKSGLLHGPAKAYNGKGELLVEGQYKNDKHHGLWKYYENGSLKEEKNFTGRE